MEAVPIPMSSEKLSFLVEYDLAAGFEKSLHELSVRLREYCRHENVYGVAYDLVFGVAKHLLEPLARIEDLPV